MRRRKSAVWFGRFQPPTIAHLAALETILANWKRVTIVVVDNTKKNRILAPEWAEYLAGLEGSSFSAEKNPFLPHEAQMMWVACVEAAGLKNRVRVEVVPRPEFWEEYLSVFPIKTFDHVSVVGGAGDPTIDQIRARFSVEILRRPVWRVKPPFMLHNTEIRVRVSAGEEWDKFIAKGAHQVFLQINGPARVRNASI